MRRALLLLVPAGLLAGATALAQDNGSQGPYALQEPTVHSAEVLRLPSDAHCQHRTLVTARVLPPPGAVLGLVEVRVGARQAARLTGVPRAASATVRLGPRRSHVTVTGTTLGGQVVHASRSYRRCGARAPSPQRGPPGLIGGGNEG